MIRGKIPFRYTDCHKVFIGLDIEAGNGAFNAGLMPKWQQTHFAAVGIKSCV